MKCYAVIDTNVLVSALLSKDEKSATVQVLERILNKEIIPIFSKEILQEYRAVLSRKKFGFSDSTVKKLISYIGQNGVNVIPLSTNEKLIDIKDLPFYEVVMATREASVLVTGNLKHFPKRDYIITPRQLIDILENQKII